ncbi:MAG TPA: urea carboxylase-associated family protein [Alphaproteobacteria bacterium]|jgi:uncharacterized protein YcgI (DUF1989 family)
MRGKLVEEFVIPARYGRAFVAKKGQVLRIQPVEDGQVGDCVFYNANDTKEWFHVGQSWAINGILKTGTAKSFKHFYSKPPRENIMLTTLEDTMKNHWGNNGGRCSTRLYQLRDNLSAHRSCQENLTEALRPFGLTGDEVMDVFNVFMAVDLHPDGSFTIKPSPVTKNDYIDLRAEMDVLAAISACPADTSPTNNGRSAPLGIKIFAS